MEEDHTSRVQSKTILTVAGARRAPAIYRVVIERLRSNAAVVSRG